MGVENIMIGADPELFIQRRDNNQFISGHDIVPGTKSEPMKILRGAIQADGVAAEFNIDPANNAKDFLYNIRFVMKELNKIIISKDKNYKLSIVPTAKFDQDYFDLLPPEPKMLGCEPDWNAYTGQLNDPPQTDKPFRTAGGHVHVGFTEDADIYNEQHMYDCIQITKALDATLYPISTIWDDDKERRTLYGKKGSFRPKPYGVEYRPLSNAWLGRTDIAEWVFNATKAAVDLCLDKQYNLQGSIFVQDLLSKENFDRRHLYDHIQHLQGLGIPKPPQYIFNKLADRFWSENEFTPDMGNYC